MGGRAANWWCSAPARSPGGGLPGDFQMAPGSARENGHRYGFSALGSGPGGRCSRCFLGATDHTRPQLCESSRPAIDSQVAAVEAQQALDQAVNFACVPALTCSNQLVEEFDRQETLGWRGPCATWWEPLRGSSGSSESAVRGRRGVWLTPEALPAAESGYQDLRQIGWQPAIVESFKQHWAEVAALVHVGIAQCPWWGHKRPTGLPGPLLPADHGSFCHRT